MIEISIGAVLAAIGAGLAIGLTAIGSGIGVGITGAAGVGAIVEKPDKFGTAIVFQALPQTQAIYGLLTAILILMTTGFFGGGNIANVPVSIGLVSIGAGLAVGFAGFSAIGQGIAAAAGIGATVEDSKAMGRGMVFSALPETQAIYGLLIAILLMAFTGMFEGILTDDVAIGFAAIGCGLAVGLAGLSGIGQGITASSAIGAILKNPSVMGRGLILSVMSETFAIFGLLIAILIMAGIGLFR